MFVYLSKKIAIPHGLRLTCVSWNNEQNWIACGGGNGLLKVLKLDTTTKSKQIEDTTVTDKKNQSQNQTLEGHNGNIKCIVWNELYQKLTSVDQYGMIIVWMLHKGLWYEEMINNRNISVVTDMKWCSDGTKICIVYADGEVIVGSVDGNRLWGKNIQSGLTHIEWSPNGQYLLFGCENNEIQIYDSTGNYITRLIQYINTELQHKLIAVQWYSGVNGYNNTVHNNQIPPCLALCYENGAIQLNTSEIDDYPVLIDCAIQITCVRWNNNGTILAVAGIKSTVIDTVDTGSIEPTNNIKQQHVIMFFTNQGKHIRTLKVPGSGISSITWEGTNLRLAIAVDSYIYFAHVRPTYIYTYMHTEQTLVYAYSKAERIEQCITFWNLRDDTKTIKYIKDLLYMYTATQHICFVTYNNDEPEHNTGLQQKHEQYALILCNTIGNPINSKYIEFQPTFGCMTSHYIICCNDRYVYLWQYKQVTQNIKHQRRLSVVSQLTETQYMYCIDSIQQDILQQYSTPNTLHSYLQQNNTAVVNDPIVCITTLTDTDQLLIARASGLLLHCKLSAQSGLIVQYTYNVTLLAESMYWNCDNSRLAIIDNTGCMTQYTLDCTESGTYILNKMNIEKYDVWQFVWATDNPLLYTYIEKNKLYLMREQTPEEPIQCQNYVLQYNDLTIQTINLDDLYVDPDNTILSLVTTIETKSLRDTRTLLSNTKVATTEIIQFIQANSHPKLWRLLGDHCLSRSLFDTAIMCYVYINDYVTIQYINKLMLIQNSIQQQCEIYIYFKQFDAAEQLYIDNMMYHNAIELRKRLGDWFRVVQLIQQYNINSDTYSLNTAYNEIGHYYYERKKYNKAIKFYQKSNNTPQIAQCAYKLDDYTILQQLIPTVTNTTELQQLGHMFQSVGLCTYAVQCYIAAQQSTLAIQCCIQLNQWATAIELATKYKYAEINILFEQYATHLLQNQQYVQCITLYQNCHKYQQAAKLMLQLHTDAVKQNTNIDYVTQKKLYLCIALQLEKHNQYVLHSNNTNSSNIDKLNTLLAVNDKNSDNTVMPDLSDIWQHVEAYHYYNLCLRQLHAQQYTSAYNTAVRLTQYDSILNTQYVYDLLCVCSLYVQYYATASQALIKLESLTNITTEQREQYKQLSVNIFISNHPVNPESQHTVPCINTKDKCTGIVDESTTQCNTCGKQYIACIASGKAILTNSSTDIYTCTVCQHKAYNSEIRGLYQYCPVCHTNIK